MASCCPCFSLYGQNDLKRFTEDIVTGLSVSVYLYNLAIFTTALEPPTLLELIERLKPVAGIIDLSASLATVSPLREKLCCGVYSRKRPSAVSGPWRKVLLFIFVIAFTLSTARTWLESRMLHRKFKNGRKDD